jgi:hypothetical protein
VERIGVKSILFRKAKERRPLGTTKYRWKDNIKMDLREVGRGHGLDLSGSG